MEYIVNAGKELGIATPIHEEVYRGLMKKGEHPLTVPNKKTTVLGKYGG